MIFFTFSKRNLSIFVKKLSIKEEEENAGGSSSLFIAYGHALLSGVLHNRIFHDSGG